MYCDCIWKRSDVLLVFLEKILVCLGICVYFRTLFFGKHGNLPLNKERLVEYIGADLCIEVTKQGVCLQCGVEVCDIVMYEEHFNVAFASS